PRACAGTGATPRPAQSHRAVNRIRILLVDDHPIVREGLRARLAPVEALEIVGEAANAREAIRKAKILAPDLVLMDISLPGLSGIAATRLLRQATPHAKILVLSAYNRKEYVTEVIRAGARGYLLKDCSPQTLVRAITAVHRGRASFSAGVSNLVFDDYVARGARTPAHLALSRQEQHVLALIAQGATTKDIARRLEVSLRTIETYRQRLRRKLNLHTVAELTRFALATGLACPY
ncbi:MAG: response regulator transcription factor, partial [Verrucomicrobia bacterium]|nr:response regulator transcription factor [Verrucomicrobiota bacterium]